MSKSRPRYDETHKNVPMSKRTEDIMKQYEKKSPLAKHFLMVADIPPADPIFTPAILADLERKLAAMVDERLASLERRVDLLYRYTVGDRSGRHMLVPNMNQRGEEFPE